MASTVASGIFNAMAFVGESGYKDEMKRHNRAMEKFNIEGEKWRERQI